MQDYYALRALEYDDIYQKPERQADLREIETWLPTRFERASVLEIACGTGYWTQFIAGSASEVLALDSASETLAIAKERIGRDNVEFVLGDAYALNECNGKYQRGFAGFWLSHVPKSRLRDFLLGFHTALEPGARLVFLDNIFVPGSNTPLTTSDAEGNTFQVRKLRDGSTHHVLKNFLSEGDLRKMTDGLCTEFRYRAWQYYWAVEYVVVP